MSTSKPEAADAVELDYSRAGVVAGLITVAAMVLVTIPFVFTELQRNTRSPR